MTTAIKRQTPDRGINMDKDWKSQYVNVVRYVHPVHKWIWYCARVYTGHKKYLESFHDTELEAALAVDRILIKLGKPPVNKFKPK